MYKLTILFTKTRVVVRSSHWLWRIESLDISLDLLINVQCALMVYNFVKLTKRKYAFNCKWVLYNIYEHVYVNQFSHIMQTFGGGVGDYINKIENLK